MQNCSSLLPQPHLPFSNSYVFYVVMQCTCGTSYYYPSRRQVDIDQMTASHLIAEIQSVPSRIDARCAKCGRSAALSDARRAVLGYGLPDRSGSLLCDFVLDQGHVQRTRWRFDATPDPIQYFRDHPDYFRTRPPDTAPTELDDLLCIEEVGRVLSVRSAWEALLHDALDHGSAFLRADEGYYLFATTTTDPVEVECQMRERAPEEFWAFFQKETIPRRRLLGVDRWEGSQRQQIGLDTGLYHEWLSPLLLEALHKQQLHAVVFSIDSIAVKHLAEASEHFKISVDEVIPPEGEPQLWLRSEGGVTRRFPPLELLQLVAIYKGRLVSDQIWLTFERLVQSMQKEERVFERFNNRLPPGFFTEWSDFGKVSIFRGDRPLEILTFAHIADQIEPSDDEALGRLVSWIVSKKECDCQRYVGKRLISKDRFQQCSAEMSQDSGFLFREREDGLVEIYTDECKHHTLYGLRMAKNDLERAEALFQRDLQSRVYQFQYAQRKAFLSGVQILAITGSDAASLAAHPALLKGALNNLKLRFGDRIRIFAPFNGILTIGPLSIEEKRLEKFAHEVARELHDQPELRSDLLNLHDIIELTEEPLGRFQMEALKQIPG